MEMKGNQTVLLIDDDADDREIFAIALAEADSNYEFRSARNGVEALDKLISAEIKADYIFLDLNMPLMNGRQCFAEIRKQPALKEIPVIIYSTSSDSRDKEQMIAMGATAFVTKPPEIGQLVTSLKDLLKRLK